MTRVVMAVVCVVGVVTGAAAQAVDKYNITAQERADCQVDATTLCSFVYPDEDRLIACMRDHRASLSPRCLRTFTAGLARRGL